MNARKKRRKGTPPNVGGRQEPGQLDALNHDPRREYPVLSFRFLQKGWGFDELSAEQCREFTCKWQERSRMTWRDLSQHSRHGLGSEMLPKKVFRPQIPTQFQDQDRFKIFRHQGNLPMAGVQVENVYYVIWIEKVFNQLYPHGS